MLRGYIAQKKLKSSRQRDEIARIFFSMKGHVNLDELYRQAARVNPRIGYTTVYRTLKLLTECGMAVERKFADGQARYENVDQGEHHDHLICLSCGKILEFTDDRIEKMQEEIAARHHFAIKDHRLEIYGACADCLKKEKNSPSPPLGKGGYRGICR
ncbi:MAG TPA: transcriptional repressor [Proteobacteria bacterium]|nr:transcriptional repressor [Pseudomonadota bacterium]